MTARTLVFVAVSTAIATAIACGFGEVALDGKACDAEGRCAQGFTCDRSTNVCIRVTGGLATLPDGAVVRVDPNGQITGLADGGTIVTPDGNTLGGESDSGAPPDATSDSPASLPIAFDIEDAGVTVRLNAIAMGSTYAVAVGENGTIVRRTARASWAKVTSTTTSELLGIAAQNDDVYVVGRGGTVLYSSNQGQTFAEVSKGTDDLYGVALINGKVRIVGADSTFMSGDVGGTFGPTPNFTPNPGAQWTYASVWSPNLTDTHLVSLEGLYQFHSSAGASSGTKIGSGASFVSVGGVDTLTPPWALSHGDLYQFTNGFIKTTITSQVELRALYVASASQVYAVGDVGHVYRRLGNAPFERLGTGTIADLRGVHGIGNAVMAVGSGGTVLVLK